MTTALNLAGRAGALAQQVVLLAVPHGLQAQARRNALRAMADDAGRRADHLAADAAVRSSRPSHTEARESAVASG